MLQTAQRGKSLSDKSDESDESDKSDRPPRSAPFAFDTPTPQSL